MGAGTFVIVHFVSLSSIDRVLPDGTVLTKSQPACHRNISQQGFYSLVRELAVGLFLYPGTGPFHNWPILRGSAWRLHRLAFPTQTARLEDCRGRCWAVHLDRKGVKQ